MTPLWLKAPALLLAWLTTAALAQDVWPGKPVTLTVPNPPGGVVDTSARLLTEPGPGGGD